MLSENTEKKTVIISSRLQNLQAVASKDTTRGGITGVYFNGAVALATDGHCLVGKRKLNNLKDESVYPENQIIRFKGVAKKRKHDCFDVVSTDKYIAAATNEVAEVVDGQFPDVAQVVPAPMLDDQSQYHLVCFDAALLHRMTTAMIDNPDKDKRIVTLCIRKAETGMLPIQPIFVSVNDDNVVGLMMPCRHDNAEAKSRLSAAEIVQLGHDILKR